MEFKVFIYFSAYFTIGTSAGGYYYYLNSIGWNNVRNGHRAIGILLLINLVPLIAIINQFKDFIPYPADYASIVLIILGAFIAGFVIKKTRSHGKF